MCYPSPASYDRLDILQWLVIEKGVDLEATDRYGRTVQGVAEASKAKSTAKWIRKYKAKKTINEFISRNIQHIRLVRKHRGIARRVVHIQRVLRGYCTRKIYREALLYRLEQYKRFNMIWGFTLSLVPDASLGLFGWEAVRVTTSDISHAEAEQDTMTKLDEALSRAVLDDSDEENDGDSMHSEIEDDTTETLRQDAKGGIVTETQWSDKFQITSHVVKFLKSGDPLYRSFFVRRMQQLANGDRSRILQKRLKGSQSTIFETYLEQKSGFRILWTEESDTIIIWFVAKHKSVSRLMKLIDDAKSRSARQQVSNALVSESNSQLPVPTAGETILLDVGNAPLKVYDISFCELDDITKSTWTPQLHLTNEERKVVEQMGTVLLLGRSG